MEKSEAVLSIKELSQLFGVPVPRTSFDSPACFGGEIGQRTLGCYIRNRDEISLRSSALSERLVYHEFGHYIFDRTTAPSDDPIQSEKFARAFESLAGAGELGRGCPFCFNRSSFRLSFEGEDDDGKLSSSSSSSSSPYLLCTDCRATFYIGALSSNS